MPRTPRLLPSLTLALLFAFGAGAGRAAADATPVATLEAFHAAASKADGEAYFALLAEDAVFVGTDPDELWTREAFIAFCEPYFARGQGWTYVPVNRRLVRSEDGGFAWFVEALDNESYGRCRGTGVLRREGDAWRIVQYSLSIPIPNDLAGETVARIRAGGENGAGGEAAAAASHRDLDALLETLYATVSGDAGVARDWDRFRALFTDDATLAVVAPAGAGAEKPRALRPRTVEQYIAGASPMFAARGFHERQVSRRIVRYGHIAHVFSVYESRTAVDDAEPFDRGINSIQLVDTGEGWRIVSLLWEAERTAGPVEDATASTQPAGG